MSPWHQTKQKARKVNDKWWPNFNWRLETVITGFFISRISQVTTDQMDLRYFQLLSRTNKNNGPDGELQQIIQFNCNTLIASLSSSLSLSLSLRFLWPLLVVYQQLCTAWRLNFMTSTLSPSLPLPLCAPHFTVYILHSTHCTTERDRIEKKEKKVNQWNINCYITRDSLCPCVRVAAVYRISFFREHTKRGTGFPLSV